MSNQATNLVEQNKLWSDLIKDALPNLARKAPGRRGIQVDGEEFPCYFRKKKQTHRQTKTSRQ